MVLQSLGLIAALSAGTPAGSKACNYANDAICVESSSPDITFECEPSEGGASVEVCPTENRLGTCTIKDQGVDVFARVYKGFAEDPNKVCSEAGGTYVAD